MSVYFLDIEADLSSETQNWEKEDFSWCEKSYDVIVILEQRDLLRLEGSVANIVGCAAALGEMAGRKNQEYY